MCVSFIYTASAAFKALPKAKKDVKARSCDLVSTFGLYLFMSVWSLPIKHVPYQGLQSYVRGRRKIMCVSYFIHSNAAFKALPQEKEG